MDVERTVKKYCKVNQEEREREREKGGCRLRWMDVSKRPEKYGYKEIKKELSLGKPNLKLRFVVLKRKRKRKKKKKKTKK
jgi:hypothetical protein